MNIHYLQHVPFEGLGGMEPLLITRGHRLTCTRLYLEEQLPSLDEIDWLIVMGGPMGIHDDEQYPWLAGEKEFIKQAIHGGKIVLGICLGAQFIAAALGARVMQNPQREIGWFNIERNPAINDSILASVFPEQIDAFHWHGDTFAIPAGATLLASSEACNNQGFIYDNRVLALQFHLETTPASAKALVDHCRDELDDSTYVQTEEQILADPQRFAQINGVMADILSVLENSPKKS